MKSTVNVSFYLERRMLQCILLVHEQQDNYGKQCRSKTNKATVPWRTT